jgi:prevent-host-death family protein
MADQAPITAEVTMSASDVRKQFSEVVHRVAHSGGRVLVEKHGEPAAILVSM